MNMSVWFIFWTFSFHYENLINLATKSTTSEPGQQYKSFRKINQRLYFFHRPDQLASLFLAKNRNSEPIWSFTMRKGSLWERLQSSDASE